MVLDPEAITTMSRVVIGMCYRHDHLEISHSLTPHLTNEYARLVDTSISTPMSRWEQYRASRLSWGINVLGSFCVEIEGTDGTVGFATGFGGKLSLTAMKSQPEFLT